MKIEGLTPAMAGLLSPSLPSEAQRAAWARPDAKIAEAPRSAEPPAAEPAGDTADLALSGGGQVRISLSLFELNYQSVRYLSGMDGGREISRESFSLRAFSLEITAQGGAGSIGLDPKALLSKLQDAFTPEKTAGRIANFALSRFLRGGHGDTEEARAAYRDKILPAVERGFQEALGILGDIDSEIRAPIERTMELVRKLMEQFVKGEDRGETGVAGEL